MHVLCFRNACPLLLCVVRRLDAHRSTDIFIRPPLEECCLALDPSRDAVSTARAVRILTSTDHAHTTIVSTSRRNRQRESATDAHGFTQINAFRTSSRREVRMGTPLDIDLRIADVDCKQSGRQVAVNRVCTSRHRIPLLICVHLCVSVAYFVIRLTPFAFARIRTFRVGSRDCSNGFGQNGHALQ